MKMVVQEYQDSQLENSRRQQLAVAVRSIQWTYAIFWSLSTLEQGVLEWGEGYYNGHVKTKKAVQSKEYDSLKLSLERSEQLRKLYEALLIKGESDEQGMKKISIALSLEELSNLEWYYLVSMSFTFKFGESLPGKALATGQHVWLYDAPSADSRVFSRSLLAKSASVQTVICFQHMGGVIELGVTDLVSENQDLIQYIKTSVLQLTEPLCPPKASAEPQKPVSEIDHKIVTVDDENDNEMVDIVSFSSFPESAEQLKFDEKSEKGLYQSALEDFIGSSDDCSNDSCHHAAEGSAYGFVPWEKEFTAANSGMEASQTVLKKVLFRVPLMDTHSSTSTSVQEDGMTYNYPLRSHDYEVDLLNFASPITELEEKRETHQLHLMQDSIIPSITEANEAFILTDTMECLARFDELQFSIDMEGTSVTKDVNNKLEQTCDNYNKSKTSEMNETTGTTGFDIEVTIDNQEVLITVKCRWREYLLIDIMGALNNLNLDTHTVQSSTFDGAFSLFLKSEFQKAAFASEEMIKQALRRTIFNLACKEI